VSPLAFLESEPARFSLPLAAASGLALGFYPGPGFGTALILVAAALASVGIALRASPAKRAARLRSLQALAMAAGIAAGAAVALVDAGRQARPSGADEAHAGHLNAPRLSPVWAEGRLSSDSAPAKNGFRSYPLRVERLELAGAGVFAELSYPGGGGGELRVLSRAGAALDSGSRIRARGSVSAPEGGAAAWRDPALFAKAGDILLLDSGSALDRARSAARDACRRALAGICVKSAGLYQALILGVRDSLAPEEAEAFKLAGCSHILALSGEHLSVLALIAVAALKGLLGPVRARLGGAIAAGLFMWIAGPGPSLLRAVLMAWIGALALALDRPQGQLGCLALTFIAMLPIDPEGARSLSFMLSFLAVWGLAVLGPRFSFLLGKRLPSFLLEPAAASLSAQAAVSPLLAIGFGALQLAGVPASMAAGPLVAAMMWWGMGAGFVCSFLPFAAPTAARLSDFLYDLLMGVMRTAASFPQLQLPSALSRCAASAAVVALAALVYARPYAEYRASGRALLPARLRLSPGPSSPPPRGRPRHVQAPRAELPRQPLAAGAHPSRTQGGAGLAGLGDRSGHRVDDRAGPRRGPPRHRLRDRLRLLAPP
jgi:competence protein ComEC